MEPKRAIVAGAGVGGLSAALALSRAGFDARVYERAAALEEFGAGLQLTPNATRVLAKLGALDDVLEAATVPKAICVLRGSDDLLLARLPLKDAERRWGAPYVALHRADLQKALVRAAERHELIRFSLGSTVTGVSISDDRVTVNLTGSAATADEADLLIGADGLLSRVRDFVAASPDDRPASTGRIAFRATIPSHLVEDRWTEARVVMRLGPDAHLVHYPLRKGSIVNVVAVIDESWRGGDSGRPWDGVADRPAIDRAFAAWSRSTRRLLAAASNLRAWPLYRRLSLGSFTLGPIALVGDAAHPMVPFLAQGAAQAIEDAGALETALSQIPDVREALASYSRARVRRATRVQSEALQQGRVYHLRGAMALARDAAMRLLGPRRLGGRYDWLYGA